MRFCEGGREWSYLFTKVPEQRTSSKVDISRIFSVSFSVITN